MVFGLYQIFTVAMCMEGMFSSRDLLNTRQSAGRGQNHGADMMYGANSVCVYTLILFKS